MDSLGWGLLGCENLELHYDIMQNNQERKLDSTLKNVVNRIPFKMFLSWRNNETSFFTDKQNASWDSIDKIHFVEIRLGRKKMTSTSKVSRIVTSKNRLKKNNMALRSDFTLLLRECWSGFIPLKIPPKSIGAHLNRCA